MATPTFLLNSTLNVPSRLGSSTGKPTLNQNRSGPPPSSETASRHSGLSA